jgi:hypothetical protein
MDSFRIDEPRTGLRLLRWNARQNDYENRRLRRWHRSSRLWHHGPTLGEFDRSDQPLQAWGDHTPGAKISAYIAAIWLVVAGGALWRRSRRSAAASLTILYGIFVMFPLPRFYWGPHVHGHRAYVYFGVLGDVCQEIILFVAAVIVWKSLSGRDSVSQRAAGLVRWTFGLCSIDFGLAHLTAVWTAVPMIPKWMPFGTTFRNRIRPCGSGHRFGGARRFRGQTSWADAARLQCAGVGHL